jgi:hypothetical protein
VLFPDLQAHDMKAITSIQDARAPMGAVRICVRAGHRVIKEPLT